MSVEHNIDLPSLESQVWKDPEAGMQALLQKEAQNLQEIQKFNEQWRIQMNNFTWRNQEESCNFISQSFPDLEDLTVIS